MVYISIINIGKKEYDRNVIDNVKRCDLSITSYRSAIMKSRIRHYVSRGRRSRCGNGSLFASSFVNFRSFR